MMRDIVLKKQFKKDVERIKRTGRDMRRLREVIALLAEGMPMTAVQRGQAAAKAMAKELRA